MGLLLLFNGSVQGAVTTDLPDLYLEWSPTTGPRDAPVWERIPLADIRSIDVNRGRNRELDQFQAGRMTVVLDNRDRHYDPEYSAGPNFGNVKPMKRIRLRAIWDTTYDLFSGFVDSWDQDYEMTNEAVCVVTATDGFKVLERTDLTSIYDDVVLADDPTIYWRFGEVKTAAKDSTLVAKNGGSLGATGNGTYVGPPELGGAALLVADTATSMVGTNSNATPGVQDMGVSIANSDFNLLADSFVVELWCIPEYGEFSNIWLWECDSPTGSTTVQLTHVAADTFRFGRTNTAGTTINLDSAGTEVANARYHIVCRHVFGEAMQMWVNGTLYTGSTSTGSFNIDATLRVGHTAAPAAAGGDNWDGPISHFAIYTGEAAEAFDDEKVQEHLAAGEAPWNGDTTGARIGRVLDNADWPAAERDIDTGESTLQSANIAGQTALAHAQLVRDTEFGELFMLPNGNVRFIGRHAKWQPPYNDPLFTLSDDGADLGYGAIKFNYDDQLIRNRVTIGYENGLAFTANSTASQDDFLIQSYSRTGLIGDVDSEAVDYANYVLNRYDEPLLRVQGITIHPQRDPATYWPEVLSADLVYQVNVERTPQDVGSAIDIDYTIEGVSHKITPKFWRTEMQLSPADTPGAFILDSTSQGILDTNALGF